MADYYITEVHYKDKDDTTFIEEVKTISSLYSSTVTKKARTTVVSDIDISEKSVMTATKGSDGYYKKGADVHVVKIDGTKYIRTDANSIKRDNLGSLPQY